MIVSTSKHFSNPVANSAHGHKHVTSIILLCFMSLESLDTMLDTMMVHQKITAPKPLETLQYTTNTLKSDLAAQASRWK